MSEGKKDKEKKDQPQVDVRDIKPNKDAKGGGLQFQGSGKSGQGTHHRET